VECTSGIGCGNEATVKGPNESKLIDSIDRDVKSLSRWMINGIAHEGQCHSPSGINGIAHQVHGAVEAWTRGSGSSGRSAFRRTVDENCLQSIGTE
jgi:hypothetical protein